MTQYITDQMGQRFAASFEGFEFICTGSSRAGANFVEEIEIEGAGVYGEQRVPGPDSWDLDGVIVDDRFQARQEELFRLFQLLHTEDKSGLLIEPFSGVQRVVPQQWTLTNTREDLDSVSFRASFINAELPQLSDSAPNAPADADELVITLGETGKLLALEPDPLAQLEAMRPLLGIPDDVTGEDYTAASTAKLASRSDVSADRVPAIIQRVGAAGRLAQNGELSADTIARLRLDIDREAQVSNSLGLIAMRIDLQMFVQFAARAAGPVFSVPGGILERIPVGTSINRLAELNRGAVAQWFIPQKGART